MKQGKRKKNFWRNNGLSLVALGIFLISWIGQIYTGWHQHNEELTEKGAAALGLIEYLGTGHFIEATFENWESEFLQMGMFVLLTAFLFQKGSSESKDPDKASSEVDEEPKPVPPDAPWPVKKGGWVLKLYENSLSLALFALFLFSFLLHWLGSWQNFNKEQSLDGKAGESAFEYLGNSKFWFESFQNWQSEFLSVFAMIVLTIFLRQRGSPQSKPVEAPDSQTGE
ncbi:MAG: hypothetical protein EOO15_13835 [Chitinophagaceae bacterium]|nr:MAG: hypothetical protein EOO15_13835 [Chitinophagaceae bacterium]